MLVVKRNGQEVGYDRSKIYHAIKAASDNNGGRLSDSKIASITESVDEKLSALGRSVSVEEIQDLVENALMVTDTTVARAYIRYRYDREKLREKNTTDGIVLSIVDSVNEDVHQENSNKNPDIIPTQRDYIAGEVSRDITNRMLLPADVVEAHKRGIIHFHDSDYFIQHSPNCCLVNLDDMLQNGTVISKTKIEKPHKFSTACNIATQIIAQVASSQYGGQTVSIAHLSPFVQSSREKFTDDVISEFEAAGIEYTPEQLKAVVEYRVLDDIARGIQTLQYQVITLMTTNGQAPFITFYMDINEVPEGQGREDLANVFIEILKQRIQGVKNEAGAWITPAFPKLVYLLDENNVYPDSKYFYITRLAAECSSKRMVPDYMSAKVMRELKLSKGETKGHGDTYPCMGCRAILTPDRSGNGYDNVARAGNWKDAPKYYGRFNQGVVTINLPHVALTSKKDKSVFWRIFDERLELCHKALMLRHERLKGTVSDVAPIHWQYGAIARLDKGETIDKLLYGGYSTISLGYAGLYECVRYMTGHSHTDEGEGKEFALEVMRYMNKKTAEWKEMHNIDFSLYGTPIESTTYKFARCNQAQFGIIPGVTDKNYITNSYHVHVTEPIDAFTKLTFESEFQELSPGGAISYVEVPNMSNNIEAVLAIINHIYENIMYAEINAKFDYCQACGFEGEMQIVSDNDKLVWECPNCGNRDQNRMNVARRTCGYIGTNFWNQGRTQEIAERVLHL